MQNNKAKCGVYAPSYYKDFKCIADSCRHSCCIDWEICIDEHTYSKYKALDDIFATVKKDADGACFVLREDGRCPHLNDNGLCDIIIAHGEDCLSEICRNHPRFYNYINESRVEAGLGIVCEEACRLVLENENGLSLGFSSPYEDALCGEREFDAIPPRNRIITIIEANGEYSQKLSALKTEFDLPELSSAHSWLDRYLSLEILDTEWERDLQAMKDKPIGDSNELSLSYGKYYERLLAYFVYRHVSVAENVENFRARLAFCILSVELIRMLFEESLNDAEFNRALKTVPEGLIDWARRYSAEIEYSEDNSDELIFALESRIG